MSSQSLPNAFAQVAKARRSVRGFKPERVPAAEIREIFELAQFAPSNCNIQPWIVHVLSGAPLEKMRLAVSGAFAQGNMAPDFPFLAAYPDGVYRARQNDSAKVLYDAMGIKREDKPARWAALGRNYSFFDAPHAAFVFMDEKLGLREACDVGMYAQTLMLGMAAHGIASCPQAAVSFCAPVVREQLGLSASHKMLFSIVFGYEDETVAANAGRVGRVSLDDSVSFHD